MSVAEDVDMRTGGPARPDVEIKMTPALIAAVPDDIINLSCPSGNKAVIVSSTIKATRDGFPEKHCQSL